VRVPLGLAVVELTQYVLGRAQRVPGGSRQRSPAVVWHVGAPVPLS
jgi:hypothetical protein